MGGRGGYMGGGGYMEGEIYIWIIPPQEFYPLSIENLSWKF